MVEAEKTLRQLSEKASKLNKQSDDINQIISAFEKKLADMNIGTEVWLYDPDSVFFDPDNPYYHPFTLWHSGKGGGKTAKQWEAGLLGYAKINDKWTLAERQVRIIQTYNRESENWDQMVENVFNNTPLAKTSRESRIKALGAMDKLFEAIEKKMDSMLESIEKGKKFVKSLD